jgi:hypothetical protein
LALILPISIFGSGSLNVVSPNAALTKVVLDSSDNAYISGSYTTVNGMSRKYVAKILAVNDNIDGNFVYNSLSTIPQSSSLSSGTNLLLPTGTSLIGLDINNGTPIPTTYAVSNGTVNTVFDAADVTSIFISGLFTSVTDSVSSYTRTNFAKMSTSGVVASGFTCNLSSGHYVMSMDYFSSNLYVGGNFTTIATLPRLYFAKVDISTGAINDLGFNCNLNNQVLSVHICSDAGIFIGGSFTNIKTTSTIKGFGKVNFSGNLFAGFTQSAVPWNYVTKIVEYKVGSNAGKILVAGFEGTTPKLYRLNSNGTVDGDFGTGGSISATAISGTINDIAIRSDGVAVVVGGFTTIGGKNRPYYARVSSTGEVL